MRRFLIGLGAIFAVATMGVAAERDAQACGGCFHPPEPPGEDPSMVTSHRMILSISSKQTTLYDQIKYSGNPKEFAWVLPISGLAKVGLSADIVFSTIGSMTQTSVNPPPMNCPPMPRGCPIAESASDSRGAAGNAPPSIMDASAAMDAGSVTVTKEETVGPYETVQLHSSDPAALNTWLEGHGYLIPDDVKPIIFAYVAEHFDFLALKLAPGQGVSSMRPVRVTTPGASPNLPLRMVAAGTGATVGITLWVIGEGRWEPQNFPSFAIAAKDLVWDWKTSSSNMAQLRADRTAASNGRGWEVENSTTIFASQIENTITYASFPQYDAGADYLGVDGGDGGAAETPSQVRKDDIDTLFSGMGAASVRITRLRSDLAHAALATDLVLQAAADQSELPLMRNITKEANEPMCPIYQGCDIIGQGPRSQAAAAAAAAQDTVNHANGDSFSCNTSPKKDPGATVAFGALAGLLGIAAVRHRKRTRRNG